MIESVAASRGRVNKQYYVPGISHIDLAGAVEGSKM
jgi:hypothetical protein